MANQNGYFITNKGVETPMPPTDNYYKLLDKAKRTDQEIKEGLRCIQCKRKLPPKKTKCIYCDTENKKETENGKATIVVTK